jgi:EAL domain-containing protein (putative c-di-GMP-specific phosphodiesterase class I)
VWGCDIAQGYHIARPMPGADVVPWLAIQQVPVPRGATA